ncbi:hypothetical protein [Actinacidiphila alni]|uniref:hypothetical protein n=1 Tax=Actinacidiphila alni TaxID=380248 RepID=UPI0034531173
MPKFKFDVSGLTPPGVGRPEQRYQAEGAIEARDADDARAKVEAQETRLGRDVISVNVRPA